MFLPGACLEDPERPGECLNQPFPGSFSYDVRSFSDSSSSEVDSPIVTSFVSSEDMASVALPLAFLPILDEEQISDDLRRSLTADGIDLSSGATVQVRNPGRTWLLIDSSNQHVYFVSRENEALSVVETGTFRVSLPVGEFCIWSFFGCDRMLEISAGQWQFQILQVALP